MPEKLVEVKDVRFPSVKEARNSLLSTMLIFSSTRVKPFPSLVSLVVVKLQSVVPLLV